MPHRDLSDAPSVTDRAVPDADPEPTSAPVPLGHADRRKQVVAGVLTVAVLAVVFVGILPKFGNYADAWDAIRNMSVAQLAVLSVSVVVSILVYVLPFQAALPGLGFGPAFMIRQSSFTISNAVPAGGAIGLGVQYGMLAQAGFPGAPSSAAIGITGVFNQLATLVLPLLGVLAMLFVETPSASAVFGAVGGLVAVGVAIGLLAAVFRSERAARRIGAFVEGVLARLAHLARRDPPADITEQIMSFRASTVDVVANRWAALTATNLAQQFAQFGVLAVALRITESGGSTQVPILAAFAAFALARLAGFIPLTPGGLGTVDAGLTGLLVAFGASRTDALAATLLWRAASWVPQVILGFVTLMFWRAHAARSRRRTPSVGATTGVAGPG